MADRDYLEIGQFGRPHGVHGEVRLFADDLHAEIFESGTSLYVDDRGDWRQLTLVQCRVTPDFGIAEFEEIEGLDAAEGLRNRSVYVPREALPDLEEGAFYQADLRGADVHLIESSDDGQDERRIGTTGGFFETNGANDVMVVWLDDDEDDELFVPMTEDAIRSLEPDASRIVLAPLEQWAPEGTEL